jgi:hypothetical protein
MDYEKQKQKMEYNFKDTRKNFLMERTNIPKKKKKAEP